MIDLLAWMVVILLVGPPLLIGISGALLVIAAVLPSTPRRARESFWCPWTHRMVTAEFLVSEDATHPSEVVACSAFAKVGGRPVCKKFCREAADVRWGLSRGVFPRWALVSDGAVNYRGVAAG